MEILGLSPSDSMILINSLDGLPDKGTTQAMLEHNYQDLPVLLTP